MKLKINLRFIYLFIIITEWPVYEYILKSDNIYPHIAQNSLTFIQNDVAVGAQ